MRGVGDLFLATGIILITSGLIGSLDGTLHRVVLGGAVCVLIGAWTRRYPRDGVRK
jgi:hypothetical protein